MNALPSRPLFANRADVTAFDLHLGLCRLCPKSQAARTHHSGVVRQRYFRQKFAPSEPSPANLALTLQPYASRFATKPFSNLQILCRCLQPNRWNLFWISKLVLGQNALGISLNAGLDDSDPPSDSWDERDWQEDAKKDADEKTNATETYSDQFDDPVSGSPMAFRVTVSIGTHGFDRPVVLATWAGRVDRGDCVRRR